MDNEELKYSIYCIQNIHNNKTYIGWSSNVHQRWISERKYAFNIKQRDYDTVLSRAFRKYAKNTRDIKNHFTFQVIEIFSNLEESLEAEMFWIDFFRTDVSRFGKEAGYNMMPGGGKGILGYKFTDEQKKKMSDKRKGEDNSSAKLTWEIVNKIRQEYSLGGISCGKLGKRYNVNKCTIARIVRNEKWYDENYIYNDKIKSLKRDNNLNNVAKLNYNIASEIREDYKINKFSMSKLAKKYNVTSGNIALIVTNKTWIEK